MIGIYMVWLSSGAGFPLIWLLAEAMIGAFQARHLELLVVISMIICYNMAW